MIYTLQDSMRLLKTQKSDVYDYRGYGLNTTHYELDTELENLDKMTYEILDEINLQLGNDIQIADIKGVLRGIKNTIINQLGKDNSRKWKKWEEEASYQSSYPTNVYDIWNDYYGRYPNNVPAKPVTKVTKVSHTTQYVNRPKKKLKKWTVILTVEVAVFLRQMMTNNASSEWGVAFTWIMDKDNKNIIIDRIYIMPVTTGGAHVDFVNESEFTIFSNISELGEFVKDIDNKTRFAGIMHSHHTMGSWHSSTDHGTIATYINDFKQVLSIVWAQSSPKELITADIILESKKEGFLISNIDTQDDFKINDPSVLDVDSNLVTRYDEMIVIVEKDFDKYKEFLKKFEKTGKFIKINELYNVVNKEDNGCKTVELVKELVL